jgi:hypothetical protein
MIDRFDDGEPAGVDMICTQEQRAPSLGCRDDYRKAALPARAFSVSSRRRMPAKQQLLPRQHNPEFTLKNAPSVFKGLLRLGPQMNELAVGFVRVHAEAMLTLGRFVKSSDDLVHAAVAGGEMGLFSFIQVLARRHLPDQILAHLILLLHRHGRFLKWDLFRSSAVFAG